MTVGAATALMFYRYLCFTVRLFREFSRKLDAQLNSVSSGSSAIERSCGAMQYLIDNQKSASVLPYFDCYCVNFPTSYCDMGTKSAAVHNGKSDSEAFTAS